MKAIIKQVIKETPRVFTVVVRPENPVSFKTGQCMRWESLVHETASGSSAISSPPKKGGRLFSIANPGGDTIEELWFTIRVMPGGIVSSHIAELKSGDAIEVKGPFGKFIFEPPEAREIALIAGGSGISVLRAIYMHMLEQKLPNNVHLFFSVLNDNEIIYKDELPALARKFSNFTYSVTLTERAPNGWNGYRGKITEEMFDKEFGSRGYKQIFYICGPPAFIVRVEGILKSRGVSNDDIKIDRWVF